MNETFNTHLAYIQHTHLLIIKKKKKVKNRLRDFRAQPTFHCTMKNSKNTDDGNKTFCAEICVPIIRVLWPAIPNFLHKYVQVLLPVS